MKQNLTFLFIVSLIVCCIEVDMSVPSFPDISDYFAISDGLTQMTVALNFLGFCLSSIFYGPLSECYGRRKVMIIGNAIMMIGAICCAISSSIEFLLAARFIQGIGASTSAVVVFAMLADVYSGHKAASIIGIMNSMLTVFMSIAPIAGGFFNQLIGWRGNYAIVAIVSIVAWLLLFFQLPETKHKLDKFSYRKVLQDYYSLLTSKKFLYASIVPSLCYSGYMAFVACGAFLYTETFGLPLMQYALHQGAIIAVFSVVSLFVGKINQLFGIKNSVVYGMAILFAADFSLFITALLLDKPIYMATGLMMVGSFGVAISYPVIFTRSLELFPEIKGIASSAIMSMRSLTCAFSVALMSYLYNGSLVTVAGVILLFTALAALASIQLLKIVEFEG